MEEKATIQEIFSKFLSTPLYIGTWTNFNTYINDYVKNKVPTLTRKIKGKKCQLCGKETTLHAAHLRGRGRKVIMEEVFKETTILKKGYICVVDLNEFARKINKIHSNPKTFHFLCKECHKKYDKKNSTIKESDFLKRN